MPRILAIELTRKCLSEVNNRPPNRFYAQPHGKPQSLFALGAARPDSNHRLRRRQAGAPNFIRLKLPEPPYGPNLIHQGPKPNKFGAPVCTQSALTCPPRTQKSHAPLGREVMSASRQQLDVFHSEATTTRKPIWLYPLPPVLPKLPRWADRLAFAERAQLPPRSTFAVPVSGPCGSVRQPPG